MPAQPNHVQTVLDRMWSTMDFALSLRDTARDPKRTTDVRRVVQLLQEADELEIRTLRAVLSDFDELDRIR